MVDDGLLLVVEFVGAGSVMEGGRSEGSGM
jgi:hypothetical protein